MDFPTATITHVAMPEIETQINDPSTDDMATCGYVMLRARESNAKTSTRFESGLLDNVAIFIKVGVIHADVIE